MTVVDCKKLFRQALQLKASCFIICHNHPSGSLNPSDADRNLTSKIDSAGEALDIKLLDHLIISANGYFSFADEGLI